MEVISRLFRDIETQEEASKGEGTIQDHIRWYMLTFEQPPLLKNKPTLDSQMGDDDEN